MGVSTAHDCHANQMCGSWKGMSHTLQVHSIESLHSAITGECTQYWPERLHETTTLGNGYTVTLSSSLPFAEYEIRKFKVQSVS